MTAPGILQFSKEDQQTLESLSNILHLFNHRNKNQHRHSIWWRHFSIFRRQFDSLLQDVLTLKSVPTTNVERIKKKSRDPEIMDRITHRLAFWQDHVVARWQHAFSQLAADGRFAVLGLVLLAILAQICKITSITAQLDDLGQLEVEKVLEDFGREHWKTSAGESNEERADGEDVGTVVDRPREIDQGVPIKRNDMAMSSGRHDHDIPSTNYDSKVDMSSRVETAQGKHVLVKTTPKTSKKKRKKGNAIDDLFSGL